MLTFSALDPQQRQRMLEKYAKLFTALRTDRGLDRFPAISCHGVPHKPFLLLSVMDLIAENVNRRLGERGKRRSTDYTRRR